MPHLESSLGEPCCPARSDLGVFLSAPLEDDLDERLGCRGTFCNDSDMGAMLQHYFVRFEELLESHVRKQELLIKGMVPGASCHPGRGAPPEQQYIGAQPPREANVDAPHAGELASPSSRSRQQAHLDSAHAGELASRSTPSVQQGAAAVRSDFAPRGASGPNGADGFFDEAASHEDQAPWQAGQYLSEEEDGPDVGKYSSRRTSIISMEDTRYRTHAMSMSVPRGLSMQMEDVSEWRMALRRIVDSYVFEVVFCIAIVTNSILIGLETEYGSTSSEAERGFFIASTCYNVAFTLELLARFTSHGCGLCKSKDWAWYCLDIFIVISSIMELVLEVVIKSANSDGNAGGGGGTSGMSNLRIIRIIRLLRVFRVARVVRFVRALRQLMVSIVCTLRALVWAMLLLLMIVYVFGILFTQAARDYLKDNDQIPDGLTEYYGSLATSMFSLFKAISDGVSWHVIVEPLHQIHWAWAGIFTVFITFTYFAVLNVLTAVFCQTAIDSEKQDDDVMIQTMMHRKELYIRHLTKLYQQLDKSNSGHLTLADLEGHFAEPSVKAHFSALDLEPDDAMVLFKLLDADSTFGIDEEEFVMGCLRLRGFAKNVDMAKMMAQHRVMLNKLTEFMQVTEANFDSLHESPYIVGKRSNNATSVWRQGCGRPAAEALCGTPD